MKKFALMAMALVSCCFLFSCGKPAPVSNEFILLSLSMNESGMINQGLHFSVGSEKLKTVGLKESEIHEFKSRLAEKIKVFHDQFYLSFLFIYANDPNPDYRIGKAVILTEPTYSTETDTIGFNMLFTSRDAWDYYHQQEAGEDSHSKPSNTSYGFMITTRQSGSLPFSAKTDESCFGQKLYEAYTTSLAGEKIDYNPDFVYDYATASPYIKSDSDYFFESGLYHHVWTRKLSQLSNDKIVLYTSFPNAPVWYLTLLGVTFVGIGLATLIIKLKNKKK